MRLDHLLSKEPNGICGWFFQGCCVSGLVMFLVSGWNVGLYHVCGGALLGFEGSVVLCGCGFSVVPLIFWLRCVVGCRGCVF